MNIKKIALAALLFLSGISIVQAATILYPVGGGTGWGSPGGIQSGNIPYGNGLSPLATSSVFQWLNPGLYSLASSTIGDGTQIGGLTVPGGATTTGNMYVGGNFALGTTSPQATPFDVVSGTNFLSFVNGTLSVKQGSNNTGVLISISNGNANTVLTGFDNSATPVSKLTWASNSARAFQFGNTNNAAINAIFSFGLPSTPLVTNYVGINATSTPFALLGIAGSAGGTIPLLAISSSTAAFATTTVFQIDQNGTTLLNNGALLQLGQNTATTSGGALTLSNAYSGLVQNGNVATGTGFAIYNTAQQATSYERIMEGWNSNIAYIFAQNGSGGASRSLDVGASTGANQATPNSYLQFSGGSGTNGNRFTFVTGTEATANQNIIDYASGLGATSATQSGLALRPILTQTGTAGYNTLLIQPTETTLGTGSSYLIKAGTSTATDLFDVTNGGKVGVGTSSPTNLLSISGGYYDVDGNTGGYKFDGNKFAYASTTSFNTVVGITAGVGLDATSTVTQNTAFGYGALGTTPTNGAVGSNTAFGYLALQKVTSGNNNTAFGWEAGNGITTPQQNTLIGFSAGLRISNGGLNTLIGAKVGENIGGGSSNVVVGRNSLENVTTGSNNVAVGEAAGTNFNTTSASTTSIGFNAGRNLANTAFISSNSTYMGAESAANLSTNSDLNSFFGTLSGYSNTTGNDNTFLGPLAGWNITTGANNLAVGWNTNLPSATASNQLNVGNILFGTLPATSSATTLVLPTSGAVGVGTSTPFAKFSIHLNNGDTNKNAFAIGSSTAAATTTFIRIDNVGHTITGGPSPSCGAGCSAVAGDDSNFRTTTGVGVTAITVNFANVWSNSAGSQISPGCHSSDESGGTTVSDASSTPTSVTMNLSASLTSKFLSVHCEASDNFTF